MAINLVLVPTPEMGHLIPAMALAEHLVARDTRVSVTVILVPPSLLDQNLYSYVQSFKSKSSILHQSIRLIEIPQNALNSCKQELPTLYMESYKGKVKKVIDDLRIVGPTPVVGVIVDMFCAAMVDVAADLGLPVYLFFTSGACLLRLVFYLQGVGGDVAEEYDVAGSPGKAVEISGFRNPVPVRVWPEMLLSKDEKAMSFMRQSERFRRTKGILVNTFAEFEGELVESMSKEGGIPVIYPVGPILSLAREDANERSCKKDLIWRWLDDQPPQSVVFLCFGSRGSFSEAQIKEIASGLELSGKRFLWSLRHRPKGTIKSDTDIPLELNNSNKLFPEGFLERTSEQGRLIGWAQQTSLLAHKAIGAFVSHCGWNSTLESIWNGVPIVAWPIYAEQQLNAFLLVKELGLATEIKIDYRQDLRIDILVKANEVADGIKKAMEDKELRKRVKEMCYKARKALEKGGSSYEYFGRFVEVVLKNPTFDLDNSS